MSKYYIDFSGYCTIEADSHEEAHEKFYQLAGEAPLAENYYEIDSVEEVEQDDNFFDAEED